MSSRTTSSRRAPLRASPGGGGDRLADRNVVIVVGTLSRPPVSRSLPSGDVVVTYEVTTRSEVGMPALTVPVSCAGEAAPLDLDAGARVVVTGAIRRRFFRAAGATQSRTEVVATAIVPVRQAAKARRAIEQAVAGLFP